MLASRPTPEETRLQMDALERAKCARVYQEKASGAKAERPELMKLREQQIGRSYGALRQFSTLPARQWFRPQPYDSRPFRTGRAIPFRCQFSQ
jgi:hypothetical protein